MTGKAERRPKAAPDVSAANDDTRSVDRGPDIPAQLRRRRDAALRLAPLDDGRRDPLDRDWCPDPWHCPDCQPFRDTYAWLVTR